jgi:hypothetical protein
MHRAENLVRELLYSELEAGDAAAEPALSQLAALARTDEEWARQRAAMLRCAARSGDVDRWLKAAEALTQSPPDLLIPADVARSLELAPAVLIDRSRAELLANASPAAREEFSTRVRETWSLLAGDPAPDELEQFCRWAGAGPEVQAARDQLEQRLAVSGSRLAREAWRLAGERSEKAPVAMQRGARPLVRQRRPTLGALRPSIVAVEFVPTRRNPFFTEEASGIVTAAFHPGGETLHGESRSEFEPAEGVRIEVHSTLEDDPSWREDLACLLNFRRELQTDASLGVRVINAGEPPRVDIAAATTAWSPVAESLPQVELAIVDRENAAVTGRIQVPARSREPQLHFQPRVGHFLALADHEVHGISLIDGCRLWTAAPADGDRSERARLGPSGPGYCIVQTAAGLCCLDPLSGRVRWQRRDVPPDAGLFAHEDAGVFGDERRLAVLEADQRTCRILATDTGEFLGRTILPTSDVRRSRLVFDARVLLMAEEEGVPRVRLWDAASQTVLYEETVHVPARHHRVDRRHAVYVAASGDVVVIDTRTAREVLRRPLDAGELDSLTGVAAWRDRDQWYVHTSHSGFPSGGGRTESVASDLQLPAITLNGLVAAYDRRDGSRLWTRPFESRSLLLETTRPLPGLVTLCRARDGYGAPDGGVTVEVIDKRTGLVVAQASNIERTRFLHASIDRTARALELCGESTRIAIDWPHRRPQPIVTAEK